MLETLPFTPWGAFLLGVVLGSLLAFNVVVFLINRADWHKQKEEWRRHEAIEAEHDAERRELAEVFRSHRNCHRAFAKRIQLTDLSDYIGLKKRAGRQ